MKINYISVGLNWISCRSAQMTNVDHRNLTNPCHFMNFRYFPLAVHLFFKKVRYPFFSYLLRYFFTLK